MSFVEFSNILSAILIPIALATVSYFWNYAQALKEDNKKLEASIQKEIADVRKTLNDWQLTIVSNYATKSEMEKMEMKIMTALERLETKIDRAFDRSGGGHAD